MAPEVRDSFELQLASNSNEREHRKKNKRSIKSPIQNLKREITLLQKGCLFCLRMKTTMTDVKVLMGLQRLDRKIESFLKIATV